MEFGLQLPLVAVLTCPQHLSEFVLHSSLLLSLSRPESPLLLVQKCLQVTGDPGFVVGEAVHRPGWHVGVLTESDVIGDANQTSDQCPPYEAHRVHPSLST